MWKGRYLERVVVVTVVVVFVICWNSTDRTVGKGFAGSSVPFTFFRCADKSSRNGI